MAPRDQGRTLVAVSSQQPQCRSRALNGKVFEFVLRHVGDGASEGSPPRSGPCLEVDRQRPQVLAAADLVPDVLQEELARLRRPCRDHGLLEAVAVELVDDVAVDGDCRGGDFHEVADMIVSG